jgi:hypothetical protein
VDIKEKIKRGGPPTRTVAVWLGADLDLLDEYERAVHELDEAQPAKTLDGQGGRSQIQARIDRLRERLEEYRVTFRVKGLDDKRWERLLAAHPPRVNASGEIDDGDKRLGWNRETFNGALVRATVIEPDLDDEDWLALLGDDETEGQLTSGQVDELATAAFTLTKIRIDVPFS